MEGKVLEEDGVCKEGEVLEGDGKAVSSGRCSRMSSRWRLIKCWLFARLVNRW